MNINKEEFEEEINKAIKECARSSYEDETFAIYENSVLQVQIKITKNKEDWCDGVISLCTDEIVGIDKCNCSNVCPSYPLYRANLHVEGCQFYEA